MGTALGGVFITMSFGIIVGVWNHYWWYADEVLFLETIIVTTSKR
jgi:hypothetical protein